MEFKLWLENKTYSQLQQIAQKGEIDIKNINAKELAMGFEVEKEHDGRMGKDTNVTKKDDIATLKIAVAHLREIPNYYSKLKKIENH